MMKFFNYLISIFLLLLSSYSFAETAYYTDDSTKSFSSIEAACRAHASKLGLTYVDYSAGSMYCNFNKGNARYYSKTVAPTQPMKCPDVGTPQVVFFDHGSPAPTRICAGSPGAYCSYANPNPDVYNYTKRQMVILRSESGVSTPTCTPSTSKDKCNASDPYGGCYTPPNDGCTRTSNGSIICPPDAPPPDIKKGCSAGASYCERPPQGCGSDYVSGNFNGKAVCVKKGGDASKPTNNDGGSPPFSGTGPGDVEGEGENGSGNGTGTGTGNNSNTSTSTSTSSSSSSNGSTTVNVTNNNSTTVNIDVSGIIKAVNQVTQTIKDTSYELNTSINEVTQAVNNNGDKITNAVNTNGKNTVDAVNAGTEATKENGKKLDAVKKSVDDGNGILKDIKDWLTQENKLPENEKPTIEEHNVGEYEKSYVSWSASCPPDVQIPISLMGQSSTLVLKWSPWCELLSKIRWAIIACAYFSAAYIILGMRG